MSRTLLDLGVGFVALAEDGLEGITAVLDAQKHVNLLAPRTKPNLCVNQKPCSILNY